MAINPSNLALKHGDPSIVFADSIITMSLCWQAYHAGLGETVGSGEVFQNVRKVGDLDEVYDDLLVRIEGAFESLREQHKPIAAIGDRSAYDADLILDGWWLNGTNMVHPISGSFAGTPEGLINTVNAIIAAVLPPPTWAWADSPGAGQLRVKCVAVAGATSYEVFDGNTSIGTQPTADWKTYAVSAGTYDIGIGGVVGGVNGILSHRIAVEVA